jgi:serpin B
MLRDYLRKSKPTWLPLVIALTVAGCEDAAVQELPGTPVASDIERESDPSVSAETQRRLVADETSFALDVYHRLGHRLGQSDENLFFSPLSISLTMAMIYGGARDATEAQMAEALNFGLPQEALHPAFNWQETTLQSRAAEHDFRLNIVNATFGQEGQAFLDAYLDLLARNYGAGLSLLDFEREPEAARKQINQWVAERTERKIPELLPEGAIDPMTVLVLVNAVYFQAAWQEPFHARNTQSSVFHAASGDVTVPMMHGQPDGTSYVKGDGYQAVSLPYRGMAFDMVIVMPDEQQFESMERDLDAERLSGILRALEPTRVALTMPKFEIRTRASMNQILHDLGMPDAFSPAADFSGITGRRNVYLSMVQHEAYVRVDEAGTEAAAATAGVVDLVSLPQPVVIDRPFLFLIRDVQTDSIVFLGRVTDPT